MTISKGSQYLSDPSSIPVATSDGDNTLPNALDLRVSSISDASEMPSLTRLGSVASQSTRVAKKGEQGVFVWDSSDLSGEVSADSLGAVYNPPAGQDGTSGAWRRSYNGNLEMSWFKMSAGSLAFSGDVFEASGSDNSAAFSAAISFSSYAGESTVSVSPGIYAFAADAVATAPSGGTVESRGLALRGSGSCAFAPFNDPTKSVTGTALVFASGARLVMPVGRTAMSLERLSIAGHVDGSSLVHSEEDDFNSWMVIGGGIKECLLINDNRAPVSAGTYVLSIPSVYGTVCSSVNNWGRVDAGDAWEDTSLNSDSVFFGRGWRVTGAGAGTQGDLRQLAFTGFDVALDIGRDVADEAGQREMDGILFHQFQVSLSSRGAMIRRGIKQVTFTDAHFEYMTGYAAKISGDAGDVSFVGGGGGEATRTGPSGTLYPELGQIVCGDATATESLWNRVTLRDFDFRFTRQAAMFVFGGSGEIVVDSCMAYNNGGFFMAFDAATEANGYPDILIKDMKTPITGATKIPRGRMIVKVSRGAAYTQHTSSGDYRWLARIENCGLDSNGQDYAGEVELPVDLDFGVRKWPPTSCFINTISESRSITLGSAVPIGMETVIQKKYSPNSLNVVVPTGFTLRGASATWTDETASFTAASFYTLKRIADTQWSITSL